MAIYFDQMPDRKSMAIEALGESLASTGTAFGKGISGLLNKLAENKLQEVQNRQQQYQMEQQQGTIGQLLQDLGIAKEKAQNLAGVPQNVQQTILKSLIEEGALGQLFSQGNQQMPSQEPNALQPPRQDASSARTMQDVMRDTDQMRANETWEILSRKPVGKVQRELYKQAQAQQNIINKEIKPLLNNYRKEAEAAKKDIITVKGLIKQVESGKLTPASIYRANKKMAENAEKYYGGIGAGIGALVGGLGGAALGGTQGSAIGSLISPGLGTALGGAKGALAGGSTGLYAGLKVGQKIGESIGSGVPEYVGSAADQAFNKQVMSFMRNLKSVFGSNVAAQEVDRFLQTLPTMSMDDEAKKAVLNQMKETFDLAIGRDKVIKQIKKEHNNYIPRNMDDMIDKRMEPYYQKLGAKWNIIINDVLSKAQEQEKEPVYSKTTMRLRERRNKRKNP